MKAADIADLALQLAAVAAAETLPGFRRGDSVANKDAGAGFDPVTPYDRAAEAAIRRQLQASQPTHGVIGEEYGEDRPDAEWVWAIDPIDGTRAYISGLPTWTTLIALLQHGEPVLGVIAQPVLREVFLGTADGAALHDFAGRTTPLRTRSCPSLEQGTVATTDPYLFADAEREAWERLRKSARLCRYGCDAYAYAMLAAGHIDVVMESGLKLWDWAPLVPIVRGAGGLMTGGRGDSLADGRVLALGDPGLWSECAGVLR